MKTCSKCKTSQPASNFYKNKLGKDGLRSCCKKCFLVMYQSWVKKNSETIRNKHTVYMRGYRERKRALYNSRSRVYHSVASALKSGKLVKGPCQICGIKENIEAHHEDYNKPLDVIWVCPLHHPKNQGGKQ